MRNNLIKRFKFGVLAGLFALMQAMLPAQAAFASNTQPLDKAGAMKVYVCKYVGKPGAKERLKEGKNPIETSTNSLPAGFNGDFPYEYSDAHESSVAIGYVGEVVLTVENCPAADQTGPIDPDPTDPTIETVTEPYANDPTCEEDGTLVLLSSEAYHWTGAENGDGPGEYTVIAVANEGYELTGETTWTVLVMPMLTGEGCEAEDEEEEEEEEGNYCNPKPSVGSVADWVPSGVDCVTYVVKATECGLFATITNKTQFEGWDVAWSEGQDGVDPVFHYDNALSTDDSNPTTFPEDYNGGSVTVHYWLVGPEADYALGRDHVENYWDETYRTITVNTNCEDDKPGSNTDQPPKTDEPTQPQVPAVRGASTDAPRQAAQEDVYVLPQTGATDSANPLVILIAGALAYGVLYFAQPRRDTEQA